MRITKLQVAPNTVEKIFLTMNRDTILIKPRKEWTEPPHIDVYQGGMYPTLRTILITHPEYPLTAFEHIMILEALRARRSDYTKIISKAIDYLEGRLV